MRWLLGLLLFVMLAGFTIGWQSRWQLLGLLEVADRLWPGPAGQKIASAIPFGDDAAQRVDVFAPRGAKPSEKRPVIVWVHGGGWNSGDRALYGFVGRAFAAQGFVTVVTGYRLAPQHSFDDFMNDAANSIRWTHANIARYGGDPDRLVLAGQSAGAHMIMLAALDQRRLGEWAHAGGPIKGIIGLAGPYDFAPFEKGGYADIAMGSVKPVSETQPITFARGDVPPVLLVTGDADETVQPRNSRVLAAALRGKGNDVTLIEYPGVDHVTTATALSLLYRGRAPVLSDSVAFARRVTAINPAAVRPD